MTAANDKVVLAFSGGLDTSFCIPYLREKRGLDVITVTVDTGGFRQEDLQTIEQRARALGVLEHHTVDARQEAFDDFVSYLIKGNILRGQVYPLSVAAERVIQARVVADVVRQSGAVAVAHGSTGAGNDQVRFDIAFQVLLPGVEVIAPIRDESLSRDQEYEFLKERGVDIDPSVREYSINTGLWGSTIGGGVTHDPWQEMPESVYEQAVGVSKEAGSETAVLGFERGVPVSLDGSPRSGVDIVARLGDVCRRHRVGLAVHIGDTVLGIKGRIAFEAGAAVVLVHAHRELEKITTTAWQRFWKDHLSEFYGKLLHEGHAFEPVLRDIEALIDSSQERVTGEARVRMDTGRFSVVGVRSPHSMAGGEAGVYGEMPKLWSGADVSGFSRIASIPSRLYRAAGGADDGPGGTS